MGIYVKYKETKYSIDFAVAFLISLPVILKIMGVIQWGWITVTFPIWGPLLVIGLFIILFVIYDVLFNLK